MRRKDLDELIIRWKRATRALRIHEQPYGRHLTDVLEKRTDTELALFKDPLEAALFFCMLDVMRACREADPFPAVANGCVTLPFKRQVGTLRSGTTGIADRLPGG
jgi:hypothetical protein